MKSTTYITFLLLFSVSCQAVDNYSVYLVRHAEKLTETKNPSLTDCGKTRAKQLANILSKAEITSLYSTSYQRTMQTAAPIAKQQQLTIKNYNPRHLEQFALQLKTKQENALVVGHSNTTPLLTALLAEQAVAPLTEYDFDFLYQVQFNQGKAILTVLQQPLKCQTLESKH